MVLLMVTVVQVAMSVMSLVMAAQVLYWVMLRVRAL